MIDLRSDTVTRPDEPMLAAMAAAEVGDDVFRSDPSVRHLEREVAELLGKDDAVYVPTGTMSNQIALRLHTRPGDVVLAAPGCHIRTHELGAAQAMSGVTIEAMPGSDGMFDGDDVLAAVPDIPAAMAHLVQPVALVECENTYEAAGGRVWDKRRLDSVTAAARAIGAGTHLDGARLWNAAAASGIDEAEWAAGFDTINVCFSKGLGAPMGSALVGSANLIEAARRYKHMHGGGFRQVGYMAAAARYALANNRDRLVEDHANAARLAGGIAEIAGLEIDPATVETNIVYFSADKPAATLVAALAEQDILVIAMGEHRIRAVANLHVTGADIDAVLRALDAAA